MHAFCGAARGAPSTSRTGDASMPGEARFEMPKEMRHMAEASLQQTRKTFDKFLTGAEAAAGSMEQRGASVRAGARDIGTKAIAFAERNVHSSLDYAQSL